MQRSSPEPGLFWKYGLGVVGTKVLMMVDFHGQFES